MLYVNSICKNKCNANCYFIFQPLYYVKSVNSAFFFLVAPTLTRIIQETIEYCKERKAFGYPIIENQIIHYTLAELQTEVEALRSLVYRAAGKNPLQIEFK